MSDLSHPRDHGHASQALRSFLGAPAIYAYATHGSRWRKPWTKKEIATVEALAGKTHLRKIAVQLGRTEEATRKMAYMMGLRVAVVRNQEPVIDEAMESRAREIMLLFSPRAREIVKAVSEDRDVPVALMLGRCRKAKLAHARQHLIWRMVRDTNMSMAQIGLKLGLDHTTCRHAVLREDARQGTNVHAKRAAKQVQP